MPHVGAPGDTPETPPPIDVLLCYRGRYREQVEALALRLREHRLKVTYDREILDAPDRPAAIATDPGAAESHWFSLGDPSADGDTGWRAPLREAIAKAYLSVFLFDARSPSVNVMNEIAWVARSGRQVFFVIDTGASDTSEDYECIVLGTLQSWFGASRETLDPVIPNFGYHFVAHDDPHAMQERLDVLAHRILTYIERLRTQGLPTLRLDNNLTMDQARDAPLERARRRLRAIQARFAAAGLVPPDGGEPRSDRFREILDLQLQREQGARIADGRLHAPGSPYAYAEASERRRLERTEEIIERARPGPYETTALFPSLARQAATIEIWIDDARRDKGSPLPAGFHPAIVLGTIPFSIRRGVPLLSQEHDNAIVLLNVSFVDFCYQLIKLAVLSWKLTSGESVTPATFQCRTAAIREVLDARPELGDTLLELVRSYCEISVPHALQPMPSLPYQMPLTLLVAFAERFTIAHGYAQLGLLGPRPPEGPSAQADVQAAAVVLATAAQQDQVDPMIAVQGCLLAVNADEIVARALERYPGVQSEAVGGAETLRQRRSEALAGTYLELARNSGVPDDDARDAAAVAREAAEAPLMLWERVKDRLATGMARDARPCPVWRPVTKNRR